MVSCLVKALQYFRKSLWLRHKQTPYFWIDFSSLDSRLGTWEFLKNRFVGGENFFPGIESINFLSDKDNVLKSLKFFRLFENGIVIKHD